MKISVLLTAYDRRDFIAEAFRSVLAQTLNYSEFEIIIVSNFEYATDDFISDLHITKIVSEGTIGEFLYKGIVAARNEIIAFLEDDDIWEKNHLEEIQKAFQSDERISYYHNSSLSINKEGQELIPLFQNPQKYSKSWNKVMPPSINEFSKLVSLGVGFNLSSIAVLKFMLMNSLGFLSKITANPDGFLFGVALLSNGLIYQNSNKLTRYRIHKFSRTNSSDRIRTANELQRQIDTLLILEEYSLSNTDKDRRTEVYPFIQLQVLEWSSLYIMTTCGSKKNLLFNLKKILKLRKYCKDLTTLRIILYSLTYIVNSGLFTVVKKLVSLESHHQM